MKIRVDKFIYLPLYLLVLTVVLFFLQRFIIDSLREKFTFFYPLLDIYVFHFLITFFILNLLFIVSKKAPKYVGYTFMALILVKMAAAVLFLVPLIKLQEVSKIPDFLSFFSPYFVFLFFEVWITAKLLKQSEV